MNQKDEELQRAKVIFETKNTAKTRERNWSDSLYPGECRASYTLYNQDLLSKTSHDLPCKEAADNIQWFTADHIRWCERDSTKVPLSVYQSTFFNNRREIFSANDLSAKDANAMIELSQAKINN